MRYSCVSFVLLLCSSLSWCIEDYTSEVADIDNLKNTLDGKVCSEASTATIATGVLFNVPKARHATLCKNSNGTGVPYVKILMHDDDYMCCFEKSKICAAGTEPEIDGKQLKECSSSKLCGKSRFCTSSASKEEIAKGPDGAKLYWKDTDVCCLSQIEACLTGTITNDNAGSCDAKTNGQCGTKGVCSPATTLTETLCCEPDAKDMCPGGLRPYAFKTGNVFGFLKNAHKIADFDVQCKTIGYVSSKNSKNDPMCCPKITMTDTAFPLGELNPGFLQSGTTACTKNADCSTDQMCAKGKAGPTEKESNYCFDRIKCPGANLFALSTKCSGGGSCEKDEVCVTVNNPSIVAANKTVGICCKAKDYDKDNRKCPASKANGVSQKNGSLVNLDKASCVTVGGQNYRVWLNFTDDEALKNGFIFQHCCNYDIDSAKDPKQQHANACSHPDFLYVDVKGGMQAVHCPNIGSPCKNAATGRDAPDSTCNKTTGPPGPKGETGVCCIAQKCSASHSDGQTLIALVSKCTDPDCFWNKVSGSDAQKQATCGNSKDFLNIEKCCPPPIPKCQNNGICQHSIQAPSDQIGLETGIPCSAAADCATNQFCGAGLGSSFNAKPVCYVSPSHQYAAVSAGVICRHNSECPGGGADGSRLFVCTKWPTNPNQPRCLSFQSVVEAAKYETNKGYVFGVISCGVVALITGIAATIFHLKYRSRNFCDRRKRSKDLKKKSKNKGGDTTTGGTSSGTTVGTTAGDTTESTK